MWQPTTDKWWPGTSTDVPHRSGGDTCCHCCPHYYRWAAPIFVFMSDAGGHIMSATWQPYNMGQAMSDDDCTMMIIIAVIVVVSPLHPTSSLPHPTNIPPPPDKGQQPQPHRPSWATTDHDHDWLGQQWYGTTMIWDDNDMTNLTSDHNDDTGNMTLQLLLPCQLTCALHLWGIDVAHDPWMYPLQVFNLWNPMYTLTCTHRLPWPMLWVWVSEGYGYRSSQSDLGVTCADHYPSHCVL